MAEEDEDFQERVEYVYREMDKHGTGVTYMLMLSWWKKQAKDAGDGGVSDETLQSSREAFGKHASDNGVLSKDSLANLLRELDLLKYVPEDVPEPEPEPIEEGLSADELMAQLEALQAEMFEIKKDNRQVKKEKKAIKKELIAATETASEATEAADAKASEANEALEAAQAELAKAAEDHAAALAAAQTTADEQLNSYAEQANAEVEKQTALVAASDAKLAEAERALAEEQAAHATTRDESKEEVAAAAAQAAALAEELEAERAAFAAFKEEAAAAAAAAAEALAAEQAALGSAREELAAAGAEAAEQLAASAAALEEEQAARAEKQAALEAEQTARAEAEAAAEVAAAAVAEQLAAEQEAHAESKAEAEAAAASAAATIAEMEASTAQMQASAAEAETQRKLEGEGAVEVLKAQHAEALAKVREETQMEMKATEEAAEEEINAVMQEVEQLKAEKAAAATEKEEWEAMITEEVDTLEKSVAEAKAALAQSEEQRAALDGNLSALQAEKAEADEYLAEFEQASIDENQQLQDKVDALTAENKAAVAAKEAAEAEVEETIAMADEEMSSAVAAQEAKAAEQVAAMQAKHEQEMEGILQEIEETEAKLQQAEEAEQAVTAQLKDAMATEKATPDGQGGTLVECIFGEDCEKLGIVFEGTSGEDIHVAQIAPGSAASKLGHLRHGMLLRQVQNFDVTGLEYEAALDRVINSGRPLKMHFYMPPTIKVTFQDDPQDFGLTFAGTNPGDVYIDTIDDDSEAGDLPGLRTGLLLVEIGGRPVQELVDSGLPAAKGHAAVVALATAPTRPLAMTFRPHHARSARNKLKAAVGMKGMLKGLGAGAAAKKTAPGASDIPTGTLVKINGRQWKVLDVADGMVQLQLCKAGGAVTAMKKHFPVAKVKAALSE